MSRRDRQSWKCHRKNWSAQALGMMILLLWSVLRVSLTNQGPCIALHCRHLLSCSVASFLNVPVTAQTNKKTVLRLLHALVFSFSVWASHWVFFRRQCNNFFFKTSPLTKTTHGVFSREAFICRFLLRGWTYLLSLDRTVSSGTRYKIFTLHRPFLPLFPVASAETESEILVANQAGPAVN